jgi:hypothetical protein
MSEQHSADRAFHGKSIQDPVRRAWTSVLTQRLFARRARGVMGPTEFQHAIAVRLTEGRRTPPKS